MKKISLFIYLIHLFFAQSSDVETSGDIIQLAIPASGLLAALILDDGEGQKEFAYSFATAVIFTHLMKRIVPSKRPNSDNTQSYISGHTAAAFQGAAFIHFRYGLKSAIIPYLAATFVGYSRVYSKQHHISDVFRGCAVGILSSYIFTSEFAEPNISIDIGEKSAKLSAFINF
ncbi:MAG: phosphatase PAP2 family protein [Calditrichaeota bacterium]|nr:phosphatase PAP2 family protein [Calditrichota bacterium]